MLDPDACALEGLEPLLKTAGLTRAPKANRAVLVGTALSPGQVLVKADGTEVRTLWGELAWQLGGKPAYAQVAESDARDQPRLQRARQGAAAGLAVSRADRGGGGLRA